MEDRIIKILFWRGKIKCVVVVEEWWPFARSSAEEIDLLRTVPPVSPLFSLTVHNGRFTNPMLCWITIERAISEVKRGFSSRYTSVWDQKSLAICKLQRGEYLPYSSHTVVPARIMWPSLHHNLGWSQEISRDENIYSWIHWGLGKPQLIVVTKGIDVLTK